MTAPEPDTAHPFAEAKRLARERHAPVYVVGDVVTTERPRGRFAAVWPNGHVTWGVAATAAQEIERRLTPPAA